RGDRRRRDRPGVVRRRRARRAGAQRAERAPARRSRAPDPDARDRPEHLHHPPRGRRPRARGRRPGPEDPPEPTMTDEITQPLPRPRPWWAPMLEHLVAALIGIALIVIAPCVLRPAGVSADVWVTLLFVGIGLVTGGLG